MRLSLARLGFIAGAAILVLSHVCAAGTMIYAARFRGTPGQIGAVGAAALMATDLALVGLFAFIATRARRDRNEAQQRFDVLVKDFATLDTAFIQSQALRASQELEHARMAEIIRQFGTDRKINTGE